MIDEKMLNDLGDVWKCCKNPFVFTMELERRGCCCCYKCIDKELKERESK